MPDLPPLLKAALQLRAETDLSRLFVPAMDDTNRPPLMTDTTRNLIIKLTSHMAYMQGQLEAHHELDDLEDYYWYRESVALRQQVADALAADEPAVPEGREPASVTGEPSDELVAQWIKESDEELKYVYWKAFQESSMCGAEASWLAGLRAVARWGNQFPDARKMVSPALAAEGEVAELVEWLRLNAEEYARDGCPNSAEHFTRAADLLERQAAPVPVAERLPGAVNTHFEFIISDADYCQQAGGIAPTYAQALSEGQQYLAQYQQDGPHTLELRRVEVLPPGAFPVPDDAPLPTPVPVSERLPGPEDCDREGRCWLLTVEDEYPQWRLHSIEGSQPGGSTMIWVPVDSSPGVIVDAFYTSHWLPFHALPLPQGEVES